MRDAMKQAHDEREQAVRALDKLRNSVEFRAQETFLDRLTRDFLTAVTTGLFAASRNRSLSEDSLLLRRADDLLESAVAIQANLREGMHGPARREQRYILETIVKYSHVDEAKAGTPLSERLDYFESEVDKSSIDLVDQLDLPMLPEDEANELKSDVHSDYARLCTYVHPSIRRIRERIANAKRGIYIGFETSTQFEKVNRDILRLFDVVLVLFFHRIGSSETGDLFIQVFDDNENWKFHKGKYTKCVSSYFDYKVERQSKRRMDA